MPLSSRYDPVERLHKSDVGSETNDYRPCSKDIHDEPHEIHASNRGMRLRTTHVLPRRRQATASTGQAGGRRLRPLGGEVIRLISARNLTIHGRIFQGRRR